MTKNTARIVLILAIIIGYIGIWIATNPLLTLTLFVAHLIISTIMVALCELIMGEDNE